MPELLLAAAQSLWTFGKANPNVQMQAISLSTNSVFRAPVMSENFVPVECARGFWKGVGVLI